MQPTQYAPVTIDLRGSRFSLEVPVELQTAITLLETGARTAEEAAALSRLLDVLKGKKPGRVTFLPEEGEQELDPATTRANFLEALRERENLLAHNTRNAAREAGVKW